MKTNHLLLFHLPKPRKELLSVMIGAILFLLSGFGFSAKATDVPINTARNFSGAGGLDGSADDADGTVNGVFTVNGKLTITGTGSINCNDPSSPTTSGACPITIVVTGDFEMLAGAAIYAENRYTSGNGGLIDITVGGNFIMHGPGTVISSGNLSATAGDMNAGNINIDAHGNINTESGSAIKADSYKGKGGDISLTSDNVITINGLVSSQSTGGGSGTNQGHGGMITVDAACTIHVNDNGRISSRGIDGGADLVHLEACFIEVFGLVESTATGHGVPSNPPNHLANGYRPDKPANSTAGVEIWSGPGIVIDNLNHNGEINSDLCCGGGTTGTSWIDILAKGNISIIGSNNGNDKFAVHANGYAGNTDDGGIIIVKSTEGAAAASGRALQADGTAFGGDITVEAKNNVDLSGGLAEARGSTAAGKSGGVVNVRSFGTAPSIGSILGTASSLIDVTGGTPANGVVNLQACGTIGFPPGQVAPATVSATKSPGCGGNPSLQAYVHLPDCANTTGGAPGDCINCNGTTIVVNTNTVLNFNTATPTCTGDPDLCNYFTWDKSGGATADKWKAVFNLGANGLLVKNGATITVATVNGYAPGIEITTTCNVEVELGGHIVVNSNNKNAGDIRILAHGNITINGEVRDQVSGTIGLPGAITINSSCGNINSGIGSQIYILGTDFGGNTISLITCGAGSTGGSGNDCPSAITSSILVGGGDITLNGLVKSFANGHGGDPTLNRPNIRVVSLNGFVTINANTANPIYDEFSQGGTLYDLYGGLLSWVSDNTNPGKVEVQALHDITVNGHGIDPSGPVRKSFAAIAAIATASNSPGGLLDIRSLNGRILGNDRSFDVSGRNRLSTNFAHIILWALGDIELNRLGANDGFNPVADASAPGAGDNGGLNELRSYSGHIIIGTNAVVTANGLGIQGTNKLTSCQGITKNGTVTPADAILGDDIGVCAPASPSAIYAADICQSFEASSAARSEITGDYIQSRTELLIYPNPFSSTARISYTLGSRDKVTLKIYNIDGKELMSFANGEIQEAGQHSVQWNAAVESAGVYFVRLQAGAYIGTYKLILAK